MLGGLSASHVGFLWFEGDFTLPVAFIYTVITQTDHVIRFDEALALKSHFLNLLILLAGSPYIDSVDSFNV